MLPKVSTWSAWPSIQVLNLDRNAWAWAGLEGRALAHPALGRHHDRECRQRRRSSAITTPIKTRLSSSTSVPFPLRGRILVPILSGRSPGRHHPDR
jgi:hypothetical protein